MQQYKNYKPAPNVDATDKQRGLMTPTLFKQLRDAVAKLLTLVTTQAVDANGWETRYDLSGRRRWLRRFLNQAAPASAEAGVVSGITLPVGVSTCAQVDRFFTWTTIAAGTGGVAPQRFILVLRANEGSTTMDIVGYSPSGATMASLMGNINCFIELVER